VTRVLVTGAGGLVGRVVVAALGARAVGLRRQELDITDAAAVEQALERHAPRAVINAAAFAAVDDAEGDPGRAFAVNRDGAAALAAATAARGIALVHISSDYVFDGARRTPYPEDATPSPISVYGESKAAGEAAVLAAGAAVVRTSWVFARHEGFARKMLQRARQEPAVRMVADQTSCPTSAKALARALIAIADRDIRGVVHVCGWPATTRHAWAQAIVDAGARAGLCPWVTVEAIEAADFRSAARRPAQSVLATARARSLGLPLASWLDELSPLRLPA
jgi:dTDP-4-dehydrorhamnose reductase